MLSEHSAPETRLEAADVPGSKLDEERLKGVWALEDDELAGVEHNQVCAGVQVASERLVHPDPLACSVCAH